MATTLSSSLTGANWHDEYLALIPDITRCAQRAFHSLGAQARAEAIQDVIVNTMLAYARLYQRGKAALAFPSVLARFAIAQYRQGRRTGEKQNCRDVLSPYAQRRKGIRAESLPGDDTPEGAWNEILVEDRHAGPAETAAARIDFTEWFASLSQSDRRIAIALSEGTPALAVARHFRLSPARISQKRREFLESWRQFQGEQLDPAEMNLLARLAE